MSLTITIANELALELKKHCENQNLCTRCIFYSLEGCGFYNDKEGVPCEWNIKEGGDD